MPQVPKKDATAQRAHDKEAKRARALSCAECRRLKLKCDKTVPCSSCKRRGCSAICPNGSLITGQGTRFVLADTEKLHQKIAHMSDRIRQLEDALTILQSTTSNEPHPLLDRELLKIKSSIELHAAINEDERDPTQEDGEESQYIDAFGTLAIRDDGAATFYGRSAGSESLLIGEAPLIDHSPRPGSSISSPDIPLAITSLSNAFPFGSHSELSLDYFLHNYLPSWDEAYRLTGLYLEQAPWFFGSVTKRQLVEELLPLWYEQAPRAQGSPDDGSTSQTGAQLPLTITPMKGGAHELGLLFIIFCFGALTDMNLPPAPENTLAEQYYTLTKAVLSLEPILDRPPSVSTVQVLSLMAIYEGLKSGENSIESTWALMGMATKLAQSIGLHRDCARWKLTPAEVQKRRSLFWELFVTDCWQSLATGRLATFSLPFVDCELPADPDQTIAEDGSIQPSFPYWKARFGAECVAGVVQGTLTSRAPKYSIILDLDRKVRDMELPKYAQGAAPEGQGLAQTMSHFMPTNYRELTLLYIHRCFFAHALQTNPNDPISTQYAPSFLAGYRSACDLLASIKKQFSLFPRQIARFWVLWTHAFSSTVMISSVVTVGSKCKVAPAALIELQAASELFEMAAKYGGRAVKFLPIIRRLQAKAQKMFYETRNGIPPRIHNDIFRPSSEADEGNEDIQIFSGKTRTVTTRVVSTAQSSSRSSSSPPSRSVSDSPPQTYTNNPSFAGVHPSLVNELNAFDGHLHAQIQSAYKMDTDSLKSALVGQQPALHKQPLPQLHIQTQPQHTNQDQHMSREGTAYPQHQSQQQVQHAQSRQHLQSQRSAQQPLYEQHRSPTEQRNHHEYQHDQQYMPSTPLNTNVPHTMGPASAHSSTHSLSHSNSYSNPRPSNYEQYPPHAQQSHQQHHPQHAQQQYQQQPQQHEMYTIPQEYLRQHQMEAADLMSPSSSTPSQYSSPVPMPETIPHTPMTNYWNGSSGQTINHISPPHEQYYQPQPSQVYTPESAMRGMAAEDRSLQETWQSYMYKVGSPRMILED